MCAKEKGCLAWSVGTGGVKLCSVCSASSEQIQQQFSALLSGACPVANTGNMKRTGKDAALLLPISSPSLSPEGPGSLYEAREALASQPALCTLSGPHVPLWCEPLLQLPGTDTMVTAGACWALWSSPCCPPASQG